MTNSVVRRESSLSNFYVDLCKAVARTNNVNGVTVGGVQIPLPPILVGRDVTVTGFSGIILFIRKPDAKRAAQYSFMAQRADYANNERDSKAFPIRRLGYWVAYNQAIKARGAMVGIEHEIPDVEPPALSAILKHIKDRMGAEWLMAHRKSLDVFQTPELD